MLPTHFRAKIVSSTKLNIGTVLKKNSGILYRRGILMLIDFIIKLYSSMGEQYFYVTY